MDYAPHPYQMKAISMMCQLAGSAMLLDPGMGKTSIALAAITTLLHHKAIKAALVIAPIRPMYLTWPNEVTKWNQFGHLRVSIVHGTPQQRIKAMKADADIYLLNPENVDRMADQIADPKAWGRQPDMLVVDESTRFKNAQSKRFKALKQLMPLFTRHHILTGTPAPQSIEDLFAQFQIVDQGERLGRFITHFRRQYMDPEMVRIGGGASVTVWHPKPNGHLAVAAKIADVSLRLQAEDYLQMPKLTRNTIRVVLPPPAQELYDRLAGDLVAQVDGGATLTAANAAAAVMKLRQIVNGAAYDIDGEVAHVHEAKLNALADLVEEQSGQPLLVAVAFLSEVEAIRKRLKRVLPVGAEIPYLGGGVSRGAADIIVDEWNRGKFPVLLAHPTSVAHGLNLQAGGNAVCWFGLTWNLEEHEQFNARVYRQGQEKPVVIHYLTAAGTVDESIAEALANKSDVQQAILANLKKGA